MKSLSIFLLTTCTMLTGCVSYREGQDVDLYTEIGGKETLSKVYGLALTRIYNDPVIGHYFEGVPKNDLRRELTEQTCELIGGPCDYEGKSMLEAHKDLSIKDSEFFLLVEYVQQAMRDIGLTYQQENRILSHLAPMKEEVVYH